MSVFTEINTPELGVLLSDYDVGQLRHHSAISGGTDNSNYLVETDRGRYVLTLLERVDSEASEFAVTLTRHLQTRGLPCAAPLAAKDGGVVRMVKNKRALLSPYLPGGSILAPGPGHCAQIGTMLAQIHVAGRDFPAQRDNPFGLKWLRDAGQRLAATFEAPQRALFEQQLREVAHNERADLPRGVIHADLFRDNVLFDAGRISGIIDWYYACRDRWLLDVAIAVNDWCRQGNGLSAPRVNALCKAYHQRRPFTAAEREHWPQFLRTAALRFWASRLLDEHYPRAGRGLPDKPAREMEALLRHHLERGEAVPLP